MKTREQLTEFDAEMLKDLCDDAVKVASFCDSHTGAMMSVKAMKKLVTMEERDDMACATSFMLCLTFPSDFSEEAIQNVNLEGFFDEMHCDVLRKSALATRELGVLCRKAWTQLLSKLYRTLILATYPLIHWDEDDS